MGSYWVGLKDDGLLKDTTQWNEVSVHVPFFSIANHGGRHATNESKADHYVR